MQGDASHDSRLTGALLVCGIITGPLFFAVGLVQAFTRPGFDIRMNALSQLSLGDLGWIQITSFILTGLLGIAGAIGVRRTLRGKVGGGWGAVLFGTFGLGLVVAGIFRPDPAFGFPPGAPLGPAITMSGSAIGHAIGFFVSMLSAIIGSFVFAGRFAATRNPGWEAYCVASGIAVPVLIVVSMLATGWAGLIVALAGAVAFAWATATSARLRSELVRQAAPGTREWGEKAA